MARLGSKHSTNPFTKMHGNGNVNHKHSQIHMDFQHFFPHIILKTCGYTTNLAFECSHTILLECVKNV
jgi:hypothetical protein